MLWNVKRSERSTIGFIFLGICIFALATLVDANDDLEAARQRHRHRERMRGPRPTDVVFKIEAIQEPYYMGQPINVKMTIQCLGTNGFAVNITGNEFDGNRVFLFDKNKAAIRKTEEALRTDAWGDPEDEPNCSHRVTGIGGHRPYISTHNISKYVSIDRPGSFSLVWMNKWTYWEDDFSVSDIVPIRVVATNGVEQGDVSPDAPQDDVEPWGAAFRGVELAVRQDTNTYYLGKDINLTVLARNSGTNTVELKELDFPFKDFRPMLFTGEGKYLFPKKWQWGSRHPNTIAPAIYDYEVVEVRPGEFLYPSEPGVPRKVFKDGVVLRPGEDTKYTIRLQDWYNVKEAGVYYILVARRVGSWDDGFPVSNLLQIEVKDEKHSLASGRI